MDIWNAIIHHHGHEKSTLFWLPHVIPNGYKAMGDVLLQHRVCCHAYMHVLNIGAVNINGEGFAMQQRMEKLHHYMALQEGCPTGHW